MNINGKKVVDHQIEIETYSPDECIGWFVFALFEDGTEASEEELENLTDKYPEKIGEAGFESAVAAADFLGD
jgi:hypothetical protein